MSLSSLTVSLTVGAVVGVTTYAFYYLGAFDKPVFTVKDHLCWRRKQLVDSGKEQEDTAQHLCAIVALSRDPNLGQVIPRLVNQTLQAIRIARPQQAVELLQQGAAGYGSPSGAAMLGLGLYWDDPARVKEPRYAVGWAVGCPTFAEAKAWAQAAQAHLHNKEKDGNKSNKNNSNNNNNTAPTKMVAVRIPAAGPVLTGAIPWRNALTPALAPLWGQWRRAFRAQAALGLLAPKGNECVACEFYVTGPKGPDDMVVIDYTILLSDTTQLLNDTFPE